VTPGPWRIHATPASPIRNQPDHLAVIAGDDHRVAPCVCFINGTNPDADGNARLVAAAPDLLNAVMAAERALSEACAELRLEGCDRAHDRVAALMRQVRSIIDRVEERP
jgi:hypothetical protein